MAIETGALFKGLTFGDVDSRDFGVYITGAGVFNAPSRDVEMVEIPGRNGAYALDKGRFGNIEVTYPAGLFGIDEADFADAISNFRNALASKKGYQRLTDDYNPTEYRMAVFAAGLQVTPSRLKAGEFDITFNCRPQRYLTSGETAVTVTSGGTITNPTLFDASPLLLVDGYGSINLGGGGDAITIKNIPVGYTNIAHRVTAGERYNGSFAVTSTISGTKMNTGDPFTVGVGGYLDIWSGAYAKDNQAATYAGIVTGSETAPASPATMTESASVLSGMAHTTMTVSKMAFVYGTAKTYGWCGFNVSTEGYLGGDTSVTYELTLEVGMTITYDGANTVTLEVSAENHYVPWNADVSAEIYDIYGTSSKNATGNPLYIDTDLGEAYKIEDGQVISSNSAVSIGAELPTLSPGENEVTFTNTITSLQIIPRWWKV